MSKKHPDFSFLFRVPSSFEIHTLKKKRKKYQKQLVRRYFYRRVVDQRVPSARNSSVLYTYELVFHVESEREIRLSITGFFNPLILRRFESISCYRDRNCDATSESLAQLRRRNDISTVYKAKLYQTHEGGGGSKDLCAYRIAVERLATVI